MNRQLIRLKRRTDDAILQVAECDDSDNLYVNVADGKLDVGTVDEVTNVTDVDSVNTVDEVSKSISYLTNVNGEEVAARGSLIGYTLTKETQSSVQYQDSTIYGPWPDSAPQFTGYEHIWTIPTGDIQTKYLVYCANPSMDTALNMSIRNGQTMFGGTVYGQIGGTTYTVPAASYTLFKSTAWSSCFTSIGGVLVDQSGNINDITPPQSDVPFEFTAVNDAIYFGNDTPFQRMRATTGTAGNYNASGIWEYWNGSAWTAVPEVYDDTNATVHDGTKSFTRTGSRYIQWQIPATWTAYDIASDPTSQYWVRWRITNFTSRTSGPALNYAYYKPVGKANVHCWLVEGIYNGGDVKITLENATAVPAGAGFQAEVVVKRL
jgi:hypothetical protein